MASNFLSPDPSMPRAPSAVKVKNFVYREQENVNNNNSNNKFVTLSAVPLTQYCTFSDGNIHHDDNQNDINNDESIFAYDDEHHLYDTEENYDSQPVSNQQYVYTLDDVLFNLPKDLYTEKLIQLTHCNEDEIALYRSILLQKAQKSELCPKGSLIHRRTTKSEKSYHRYAVDCYALQEFINNNDPKILANMFTCKRVKSETNDDNPSNHDIENQSILLKITEIESNLNLAKHTIERLQTERLEDKIVILELKDEIKSLKQSIENNTQVKTQGKIETETLAKMKNDIECLKEKLTNNPTGVNTNGLNNNNTVSSDDSATSEFGSATKSTTSLFKSVQQKRMKEAKIQSNKSQNINNKPISKTSECITQDKQDTNNTKHSNTDKISFADVVKHPIPVCIRNREENSDNTLINNHDYPELSLAQINKNSFDAKSKSQEQACHPVFESVHSRKTRRYYVGGIASYSNRDGIIEYLTENNVTPVGVKLIDTNRGSLSAKITVYQDQCYLVEDKTFWPPKIYCRRWYSEREWESKFYTYKQNEEQDTVSTS